MCSFAVTKDKKEVLDEIDELVAALPKSKKRVFDDVDETGNDSGSGLRADADRRAACRQQAVWGWTRPWLIGC